MAQNQSPAKSTVEGELSLDDLEKIAGGTNTRMDDPAKKVVQSTIANLTNNGPQLENPGDVGA